MPAQQQMGGPMVDAEDGAQRHTLLQYLDSEDGRLATPGQVAALERARLPMNTPLEVYRALRRALPEDLPRHR
jgi:hypothetical protein